MFFAKSQQKALYIQNIYKLYTMYILPDNLGEIMFFQKGVGLLEMIIAEKAIVRRKWRRMSRFQDQMLGLINENFLAAGIAAPEHEDEMIAMIAEIAHRGFGKSLPTVTPMRAGLVRFHGQDIVE